MITKLNLYNENILVPRNLEGRKDKLRQETIKLLGQEVIDGDLIITKEMLDIPSDLVKVKTINGDLDCNIYSMGIIYLSELPEWFKNIEYVNGDFDCSTNKLKTLKNCPQNINGGFWCNNNKLTTLEYGPKYVGKNYYCSENQILLHKPKDCEIEGKFMNTLR